MVYEILKEKNTADILQNCAGFNLLPKYGERSFWDDLPDSAKNSCKESAGKLKEKQYAILPATFYMEFAKSGNRAIYEAVYFERRRDLMTLLVAECVFAGGEYINKIIDLVWAVCEESSWVPSPHNNKGELPDIEYETYIDLFAAETGAIISWVYYFLGDEIEKISPTVKRRMEIEVERRILAPYIKYDHFWYMGLTGDRAVNNWNPWINSNVIVAFAIFEKDREKLIAGVEKTAKSLDRFIAAYRADGACDEGPGYFGVAGASMFDYLEILSVMTGGATDSIYENELIKNMARYIYRVYIGGNYFVNFADASPKSGISAKFLARVGEAVGDGDLIGFACELNKNSPEPAIYSGGFCTYRNLKSMFFKTIPDKAFTPPDSHWFDGTEILTARDGGIFMAAKGGHNAESHNHNDVGNFILYSGKKPVIIDAGVETYTKKTFSSERYKIWTMQSCYHNLPTLNGFDQLPGETRRASNVRYRRDENGSTVLFMELKSAYPEEAGIGYFGREFVFGSGKLFAVCDRYMLKECKTPAVFNLLCANRPEIDGSSAELGENITMSFEGSAFFAHIDEIELTDEKIKRDWERDYLYRIRLIAKEASKETMMTAVFKYDRR